MVKNVLFDLGKVLYEIDIDGMVNNFNRMISNGTEKVVFSMETQPEMFTLLETGKIGEAEFAKGMIEAFQLSGTPEEVIEAWFSILVGIIPGRIEAIATLASHYTVGILSNTNAIHFRQLDEELKPLFAPIDPDYIFLSYQMGLRKPLPGIYQEVLRRTGWNAGETLFIDDGYSNSETAKSLGFQTVHFQSEADFEELMERLV